MKKIILGTSPIIFVIILLIADMIAPQKYELAFNIMWLISLFYTLSVSLYFWWEPKREKKIYKDGYFKLTTFFNTDTLDWYKEYCYYKDNALLYSWKVNSMSQPKIILNDAVFINLLNKPVKEMSFIFDDDIKTITMSTTVRQNLMVRELFSDSLIESLMVQTEK